MYGNGRRLRWGQAKIVSLDKRKDIAGQAGEKEKPCDRVAVQGFSGSSLKEIVLFRKILFSGAALADASKTLVELGHLASAVDHALHASPGRMRLRVDIKTQGVASRAHARIRLVFGAIGHDDVDLVIVRVNILFHFNAL